MIKERIIKAREIQYKRYGENMLNFQMNKSHISEYCKLDKETNSKLEKAVDSFKLSVRMYNKILKVSRTIADLTSYENIKIEHILEALNYRKK